MKKSVLRFIAFFLLFLLPVSLVFGVGFFLPPQFEEAFTAELPDKIERLDGITEPKIVIIGGSSTAFGLDSALLEEATGMPVVNFGLYASIGTKAMMDLSRASVRAGDIVVIAPEMNEQSCSLYFGAGSLWYALDGHFSLLTRLRFSDMKKMLGAYWDFAETKLRYMRTETAADPVYRHDIFNEYGDIEYLDRAYNVMALGYDSSLTIKIESSVLSDEFIEYVNEYTAFAEKKGATVYYGFAPMNRQAVAEGTTRDDLRTFLSELSEKLDCPVLGDPNGYIYKSGYFYDSNFHLNTTGVVLHTRQLAFDLCEALGKEPGVTIEKPEEPEKPETPTEEAPYDENEKDFLYEEKAGAYLITGVSEAGKRKSVLITPTAVAGVRTVLIDTDAFADCPNLRELTVTANVSNIADGAFSGAPALTVIHILAADPNATTVNGLGRGLLLGLSETAVFRVPKESYETYQGNYFWSTYADRLQPEQTVG